jgi:hypothetical protein
MIGPCKTCTYWKELSPEKHTCIRYPPAVFLMMQPSELDPRRMMPATATAWPVTEADDDCGEWKESKKCSKLLS